MDNKKTNDYFIQKIQNDLNFIITHINNITKLELSQNEVLLDSMLFRLIQISENAKKLSEDFKIKNKSIPWTALYGFRNRIVHDYGNVELDIVYDTLKEDIPELLELFKSISS